jgi:uncharacterized glyoxalase superfamily metalloenzyme YdcJ
MTDNTISIHQITSALQSHKETCDEIQRQTNNAFGAVRERVQAVEHRLDDLVDSDRWKHKEVETHAKEIHSLKKFVFGTGKHDTENTLIFQAKAVGKASAANTSQINLLTQRFEDYDRWLRYIIVCLTLITVVTVANGVSNFIWFILMRG